MMHVNDVIVIVLFILIYSGFSYCGCVMGSFFVKYILQPMHQRPETNRLKQYKKALKKISKSKILQADMQNECPICLSSNHQERGIYKYPVCGHTFHRTCFENYLKHPSPNVKLSCPVCRNTGLLIV